MQKGVYPYVYMDDWEKFNETSFIEKEDFYSCLNMEDIIDADYKHAKRVFKNFEIKGLWKYDDVFENARNMCLKMCKRDRAKFISAPGLGWQTNLK